MDPDAYHPGSDAEICHHESAALERLRLDLVFGVNQFPVDAEPDPLRDFQQFIVVGDTGGHPVTGPLAAPARLLSEAAAPVYALDQTLQQGGTLTAAQRQMISRAAGLLALQAEVLRKDCAAVGEPIDFIAISDNPPTAAVAAAPGATALPATLSEAGAAPSTPFTVGGSGEVRTHTTFSCPANDALALVVVDSRGTTVRALDQGYDSGTSDHRFELLAGSYRLQNGTTGGCHWTVTVAPLVRSTARPLTF